MRFVHTLLALVLACCTQHALGQSVDALRCGDEQLATLARHLKIAELADKVVSTSCKAWPHVKGVSLAAVAYDAGISDQKALVVAAIDNSTESVLGTYEVLLTDDHVFQVSKVSLRLDTAAYRTGLPICSLRRR
jgi:hypothetical protein